MNNNNIDEKIREELKKRKLIKKRIRIMNKDYGSEEFDLKDHGIINPTGYQILNKELVEVYMKGKIPNKSDEKVKPLDTKNATKMTIEYFNGYRNVTFH